MNTDKKTYDEVLAMIVALQKKCDERPPWTLEDLEKAKAEARTAREASVKITASMKLKEHQE